MTILRILPILSLMALVTSNGLAASLWLRGHGIQQQLVDDAADGRLDDFDFLSAALVAGGIDNLSKLEDYRQQVLLRCAPLLSNEDHRADKAEAIFEFLHQQVLTGKYHLEYTALSRAVEEGHYNCVSATILYYWMCEHCGVAASIIARREHVLVRLPGTPPQDVETTCAKWFRQSADKREASSEAGRKISNVQLLGKVFYNRAVGELAEQDFVDAIDLLRISLDLDPQDTAARENLLAAINNWSLAEAELGHFRFAAQLLTEGRSLEPLYAPFLANDLHVHQQWIQELCRLERYSEAIDILESGHRRRKDAALFDVGRLSIYQLWAESLFSQGRGAEAHDVLEAARRRYAQDDRWRSYEAAALENARS